MIFFQGEKNDGFNVLYQNMKGGITAARELGDFLRERAKLEEDNSKVETVQDFLCQLGIKPHMNIVEIVIFSLYHVIIRPTKIINNLLKDRKILIFNFINHQCWISVEYF